MVSLQFYVVVFVRAAARYFGLQLFGQILYVVQFRVQAAYYCHGLLEGYSLRKNLYLLTCLGY
jgi:hypothetical protein